MRIFFFALENFIFFLRLNVFNGDIMTLIMSQIHVQEMVIYIE